MQTNCERDELNIRKNMNTELIFRNLKICAMNYLYILYAPKIIKINIEIL